MQRVWAELDGFPNYQISNYGEFANIRTDRDVRPSRNQLGHAKITLIQDGRQLTRSVAVLVAQTFLPRPDEDHFDTPIHLDGELLNCQADNLAWRPRWFAIKYHKQFRLEDFHDWNVHLVEVESGEQYESVKEACIANGVYFQDVVKSFVEGTFVFPTWQEFRRANAVA